MKIALCSASTALLCITAHAQGTATSATTATSAIPSCTASPITKLCDYPSPGPEFAVASSGKEHCWAYCNGHRPCDFVIFAAGNPYTGTGTCWLYPGKTFDASAGSTDCGNPTLHVYNEPECSGGNPNSGACDPQPSSLAAVCGYPSPGDCDERGCTASQDSPSCFTTCAKDESCSYAVFNPRGESGSQFSSGTCWTYRSGTYDEKSTISCSGEPEQYVYLNKCHKPSSSSSSASSASSTSPSLPATTGNETGSDAEGSDPRKGLATGGLLNYSSMVLGMALFVWQALR